MKNKIIPGQFFNCYGNYHGLRFQDVQRGCAFRNIDGDCTHHDNELSEESEPPCACDYCPLVETDIEYGDETDYSEGEQPVRVVNQIQPPKGRC